MKCRSAGVLVTIVFLGIFAATPRTLAQTGVPVQTVVTATTKSSETTDIPKQSVTVLLSRKPQQVSGWIPLRGPNARLQLVILLDDSSRTSLGSHLNEIKDFINGLPPSASIAVGYMLNGSVDLKQGFTNDHNAVINTLRIPLGSPGANASPYFCLSDLVKRWPVTGSNPRREVIMITDGVDRYSGRRYDPDDPYVQAAIRDAQTAGIIVYSIYFSGAGGLDRRGSVVDGGQNYLIQVSTSTGGETYYEGFGNPVSFAPFLSDIQRKLQNQYELSFIAQPKKGLQPITVKTSQPNTKLTSQQQILAGGAVAEK
jgi:hypothetical protein